MEQPKKGDLASVSQVPLPNQAEPIVAKKPFTPISPQPGKTGNDTTEKIRGIKPDTVIETEDVTAIMKCQTEILKTLNTIVGILDKMTKQQKAGRF